MWELQVILVQNLIDGTQLRDLSQVLVLSFRGTHHNLRMPADIVETTVVGDITIVKTVTPPAGYNTLSDEVAFPTKEIKAYRESLKISCSFCHKSFSDKLVCAKVQLIREYF